MSRMQLSGKEIRDDDEIVHGVPVDDDGDESFFGGNESE